MLSCKICLSELNDEKLKCGLCHKCDGKSKLDYPFERDLLNSDDLVKELMEYVENNTIFKCKKTEIDKYPDINVYRDSSCRELVCRIEAKFLEGQAFMKSKERLGLYAKETLVVDEPKLQSYFKCKEIDRMKGKEIPIYVVWKFDRPCLDVGGIVVFQEVDELQRLHRLYGYARAFTRKASKNDFQNGKQLGIIEKYHYSIMECEPIEKLVEKINCI